MNRNPEMASIATPRRRHGPPGLVVARLAAMLVVCAGSASLAGSVRDAAGAAPPAIAGEFGEAPTSGLPDPQCAAQAGGRTCLVSSAAGNAAGDLYASFGPDSGSPGAYGLFLLPNLADRWRALVVGAPELALGPASAIPSVAVSRDGTVFALARWDSGADQHVLESFDGGATWSVYSGAEPDVSLVVVDRSDTLWIGSPRWLRFAMHPARPMSLETAREEARASIRADCFDPAGEAGEFIETAAGRMECRFPSGRIILCTPELRCTDTSPEGDEAAYRQR